MGINRQAIMCMTLKKKKKTLSNKNHDYNEAHFCFIGPPLAFFFNTKLAIKARSL